MLNTRKLHVEFGNMHLFQAPKWHVWTWPGSSRVFHLEVWVKLQVYIGKQSQHYTAINRQWAQWNSDIYVWKLFSNGYQGALKGFHLHAHIESYIQVYCSAEPGLGCSGMRCIEEHRLHNPECTMVIPCCFGFKVCLSLPCKGRVQYFRTSMRKKTQHFEQVLLISVNRKPATKVLLCPFHSVALHLPQQEGKTSGKNRYVRYPVPQLAQPGLQSMCIPAIATGYVISGPWTQTSPMEWTPVISSC